MNTKTGERPAPTFEGLPELCYIFVGGNRAGERIGIVKRGIRGYYLCDFDNKDADPKMIEKFVEEFNEKMGVTKGQALAMSIGSMCGWDTPGSDPSRFTEAGQPIRR